MTYDDHTKYKKRDVETEARHFMQRIKISEKLEQRQRQPYDNLPPTEITNRLLKQCEIPDITDLEDLENRLMKQALTLDSAFFVSMHQSGLGQKSSLDIDPVKIALFSQKLCRQTYDTLKSRQNNPAIKKFDNQTIELENDN